MEDRFVVQSPVDASFLECHLLAVFDGHRGPEAAAFSAGNLRPVLADCFHQDSGESCLKVRKCISSTILLFLTADFVMEIDRAALASPVHANLTAAPCIANALLQVQECFLQLDRRFRREQDSQNQNSSTAQFHRSKKWPGCTALTALLIGSHIWIANAGQLHLATAGIIAT